jgi:hypothetical protein
MSSSHSNHAEIHNPGTFEAPGSLKTICVAFVLIGIATFAGALATDPTRAWASFVQNHFYFMSLGLGGIFFAAIQWLTGAMWSAPVRRLSEAFSAYLPVSLLTLAALYFGLRHIYIWADPAHVHGDLVLEQKAGYLSPVFFIVRNLVGLGILTFLASKLVGNSVAQDSDRGNYAWTARNRKIVPGFLILFGLLFTMASFDQMMSLDPHWYSTMFGVYCFAGLFYSTLASVTLLALYLRSKGKLDGILNDNHVHDMGKFMFAFTVFWAYIGFCQFLLIWYANLPEETLYYIHRMRGSWFYVSAFLLFGKFFVPFFLLLPREAKRNARMLTCVGIFMLVAQWVDVFWMVQPEFFKDGLHFGWVELGIPFGFLGVFGLIVIRFLSKNNIVAIGDPRLAESVFHHHQ